MSNMFAVSDTVLLHMWFHLRKRGMTVPRNSLTRYTARHLRIRRLVQFIFVGAVYHNALTNCAALLCRALRRVARICSSNLSDAANMSGHGSTMCSPTVEKILCRSPIFEAVTCRQSAPDSPRERGDSQEGGNRRCLPSCAPARRQRTFRSLLKRRLYIIGIGEEKTLEISAQYDIIEKLKFQCLASLCSQGVLFCLAA